MEIPKENGNCANELVLNIEGQEYKTKQQYLSGLEIKNLANLPVDTELYMTNISPWKDTFIPNEEVVDLARPGIEGFYIKKKLEFIIDCTKHEWDRQYILGEEIRRIGKIPAHAQIFLSISGPYNDEAIEDFTRVDLARPGIERFYFKIIDPITCIIVNSREKSWTDATITYEQVLELAGIQVNEQRVCTVSYSKGPHQNPSGEMTKGDIVFVKNKMIFNAIPSNRS